MNTKDKKMRVIMINSKVIRIKFDFNFPEFIDFLENSESIETDGSNLKSEKNIEFCKTASFDDAMNLLKYGDRENAKKASELKIELDNIISNSKSNSYKHDFSGSIVDVGRLLEGIPDCVMNFSKEIRNKNVKIYVNIGASNRITSQSILLRAIAITSIIEQIESNGIGVELFIYSHSFDLNQCSINIKIKNANEILDLDRLVFCFHPSFLRRLIFRVREQTGAYRISLGVPYYGYGESSCFEDELIEADIHFDKITENINSIEDAVNIVKNVIKNLEL